MVPTFGGLANIDPIAIRLFFEALSFAENQFQLNEILSTNHFRSNNLWVK
jgi:hypothetical protein